MTTAIIYHNPRCSKSRQALGLLQDHSIDTKVVEYLKTPLNKKNITTLLKILNVNVDQILRSNEEPYKSLNLKNVNDAEKIDALVKHPVLLQRPIVVIGHEGVVARPPEKVLNLL